MVSRPPETDLSPRSIVCRYMQSPAGRVVGARSVLFERSELRTTVEMTLPARPYALGQPTNDAPDLSP